jgi:hypothetical protein
MERHVPKASGTTPVARLYRTVFHDKDHNEQKWIDLFEGENTIGYDPNKPWTPFPAGSRDLYPEKLYLIHLEHRSGPG